MNKNQLIDELSKQYAGNRAQARKALDSVLDTITRQVSKGEKVAITGFGAFEKKVIGSRMVRNPATGERKRAKKTSVPKFRPGQQLKDVVSGARKMPALAVAAAVGVKSATKSTAAKPAATKSTARKTATKAAPTKSTAKKSTARKTTAAKSTAAKKTAARSTAKRTAPAKRPSTARKTTARKR
ncbi:MAG: HU family DNA-binding protein [Sciscionella sp.]